MAKAGKRSTVVDYLMMVGLAALMAVNYQVFILHNAFAPAGINGLATMVQYLFHFNIGYMSLIINIPLALGAFFLVDRRFSLKTFVFVLVFSGCMLLFQDVVDISRFMYHTNDGRSTLLAPIASGAVNGMIYGAAIRRGGSTGGTDYIAAMVHKKHPEYPMMRVIFVLNVIVAGLSYFVYDFNIEPVVLCILYSYLTTQVSDGILKGGKQAIKVEVFTNSPGEISERLIRELHHSVTILNAEGGYSHTKKAMLVCVINKQQITKFTDIVGEYPETFACVSSVNETLGNFKRFSR